MKLCCLTFAVLLATAFEAAAANWFVTGTGAGNNGGQAWTNAFNQLSGIAWASLADGDTIFVAGYTNYANLFWQHARVTLKRATAAEPICTNSPGWNPAFDAQVIVQVPYGINFYGIGFLPPFADGCTVDGVVTNGIKFQLAMPGVDWNTQTVPAYTGLGMYGNNTTIRHVEVAGNVGIGAGLGIAIGDNSKYGTFTNHVIQAVNLHDLVTDLQLSDDQYWTISGVDLGETPSNAFNHGNALFGNNISHGVMSQFQVHDFWALGLFFSGSGPPGSTSWTLYDGLFYQRVGLLGTGVGLDNGGTGPYQMGNDWHLYNLTFYNVFNPINTDSKFTNYVSSVTGGSVTNCIFYLPSGVPSFGLLAPDYTFTDLASFAPYVVLHGVFNGANPFVNASGRDFHIIGTVASNLPRSKGFPMPSPYNVDFDGNLYANPPSIGAYEFNGAPPSPPVSLVIQIGSAVVGSAVFGTP